MQSTTTTSTTPESMPKSIGSQVADTAKDAAGKAVDVGTQPIQQVAGAGFDELNQAAASMAGSSFGDLAQITLDFSDPEGIVLGPFTWSIHVLAGAVAYTTIATTMLFLILMPRRKLGQRMTYLGESAVKFLLISSVGVTVGVFLVEASGSLTAEAIEFTLPNEISTDGANIYQSALAVIVVPLVGVAFEFQRFLVGVLIAVWPLAAAISILKTFKHALPVCSAALVANVVWPPLSALLIGKAFVALPDVGTASWLCLAAVAVAPLANLFVLSARSTS